MKALIRGTEKVTEEMNIPCVDWNTGAPLTNPGWFGGPYILVNDYIPEDPTDDFAENPEPAAAAAPAASQDPVADTIVIDGITYTRTS